VTAKLFLRLDLGGTARLGPGKVRLLESIEELGSISAAGRALKMSYRRAWLLVDELNSYFPDPVVTTTLGGAGGGRATVTPVGHAVIRAYRDIEADAEKLLRKHGGALTLAPKKPRRKPRGRRTSTTPAGS